ncbi:MAG: hypothetical protein ACTSR8_04990 [Promethearchaeota archaeon]
MFYQLKNRIILKELKKKEKKRYGSILSSTSNSLYYLSRAHYINIIDDDYLWDNCFAGLFGNAYRSFIKESLEDIANLGHLDKHNRENEEFKKIYSLIQQNLLKSKQVLEKINQAYINLFTLQTLIYKKKEIIPRFNYQEKTDKLEPLSLANVNLNKLKNTLKKINSEAEVQFEQFVRISDISYIQDTYSLSYRDFIGALIYLINEKEIEIIDFFGANIITDIH